MGTGTSEEQKRQWGIRPAKPLRHQTVEVNCLLCFSAANETPQASAPVRSLARTRYPSQQN